jgi:hypothetical protein
MIRMVAADNMRLEKLAADQEVIMQRMKLEKPDDGEGSQGRA